MSQRDCNRQVAKRQRIRKGTLIVGVDISKAFNAVGFMNKGGQGIEANRYGNRRWAVETVADIIEGTGETLRYSVSAKNSLHAALDDYFPELHEIFWSMGSPSLWTILEQSPFPQDVMLMEVSTLQELIARSSRKKAGSAQKAKELYEAAQRSIGVKQIGSADCYRVRLCLEEVKRTVMTLKNIAVKLKRMLKEIPSATYLMSIPGIGPLSAAVFLGELGDPTHFHNARQIVKYAGYDPQESDAGSRIGRRFISKKGRWLLRKYLFFMSMRVVVLSSYFQEYYLRKLEIKNRIGQQPRRKEMLCAVAIKLIKVIFALLRDKREFEDLAPAAAA